VSDGQLCPQNEILHLILPLVYNTKTGCWIQRSPSAQIVSALIMTWDSLLSKMPFISQTKVFCPSCAQKSIYWW